MKKLMIIAMLLLIATTCFATSIAEYPTFGIFYESQNASAAGASATLSLIEAQIAIPVQTNSNIELSLKTGNNYGISTTIWQVGYRFQIKNI